MPPTSLALIACLTAAASGAVLLDEPFAYPDGPLADQGGWFDTSQVTVENEVAIHSGAGNGPGFTFNAKHAVPRQSAGTVWIAMRVSQLELNPPDDSFGGLGLFDGGQNRLLAGTGQGLPDRWTLIAFPSTSFDLTPIDITQGPPQLVLVRISFGFIFDTAELWVDPADPLSPGPALAEVQAPDFAFDRVALRGGDDGSVRFAFDRLGVATSLGELFPDPCPTDLDSDGETGFGDLLELLGTWGDCAGCPADLDGSGAVDFNDLLEILGAWGPCA